MEHLPKIEYHEKRPSTIYLTNNKSQYNDFLGRLEELLIGDIWALVVDNEIIFNSYELKSVKKQIQENILRHEITNYPHSLFENMINQKKDGQVIFYMYGYETWFVIINYTASTESFKIDYCKSQKFIDNYDD